YAVYCNGIPNSETYSLSLHDALPICLQKARDTDLRGTPTVTVSAVSGEDSRELISFEGAPAEPLATTLDVDLHNRADEVLADVRSEERRVGKARGAVRGEEHEQEQIT